VSGIVTLLTDFGMRDGYVAAVKGVLLSRAPGLIFVDVSHDIPPGDVAAAAFALLQAAPHFPAETVHLAVVDPGVGGPRRGLAARVGEQLFVGPDNGLLTHLAVDVPVVAHEITSPIFAPRDASPVFHGRDVFAPVAAFLAQGGAAAAVGGQVTSDSLERLELPQARATEQGWDGAVIHVDHFGNLISNVRVEPESRGEVVLGAERMPLVRTYSDVPAGSLVAVRGSTGRLEVACNGGSAAELTGATRGDVVTLRVLQRS